MKKAINVKNEAETWAWGQKIGQALLGGELILLSGPLGAGKTTLTKGMLEGAGASAGFSPTFVLAASHKVSGNKALKELHHLDLYRLKEATELLTLGLYDLVGRNDTAVIVEWADRFPEIFDILPENAKLSIDIKVNSKGVRNLLIKAQGVKHEKLFNLIFSHS